MKSIGLRADYPSVAAFHDDLVPTYKSAVYRPLLATIRGASLLEVGHRVSLINPKRAAKRIQSYVDPAEMVRVRSKMLTKDGASIRFGVAKDGLGYHGERGDFCLVGGYAEKMDLYLFWRSLELIGGFGYDLALIDHVCDQLHIRPVRFHLHAMTANVFALQGNSNQKLFPKLKEAIHG